MRTDDTLDEEIGELLARHGQRYTTGRRAIVAALRNAGQPVTIPQILDRSNGLAQSSVYRNLVVLEDVAAVVRIVTNDEFARYELAETLTEHHHHMICSSCGDVADFSLPESAEQRLDKQLHAAAQATGFSIEGHRLDLVGTCQDCVPA